MKISYTLIFLILFSCKRNQLNNEFKSESKTNQYIGKDSLKLIERKLIEKNSFNKGKIEVSSKIINSKFDINLLFGIWTYDPKGPHADFHLSRKSFYVVDYDGNGEMPYLIHKDSIKVFYNDFTSVGIITYVTNDSLIIDWDNSGNMYYTKWKE